MADEVKPQLDHLELAGSVKATANGAAERRFPVVPALGNDLESPLPLLSDFRAHLLDVVPARLLRDAPLAHHAMREQGQVVLQAGARPLEEWQMPPHPARRVPKLGSTSTRRHTRRTVLPVRGSWDRNHSASSPLIANGRLTPVCPKFFKDVLAQLDASRLTGTQPCR